MTALKNLALLAIGAFAGYLVAGVRYEKKYVEYTEKLEQEYAKDKADSEKTADPDKEYWEEIAAEEKKSADEDSRPVSQESAHILTPQAATALRNYQSMSKSSVATVEPETDIEKLAEKADPEDPTLPYVITQDEFADGDNPNEVFVVSWFTGDNVVADENNEKLPQAWVTKHIGHDNLQDFATQDEHYMYVRCESQEKDFEVAKVDGYFSVDILGHSAPGGDDAT